MTELTSADRLAGPHGGGILYTFTGVPGLNPRALVDTEVRIDGKVYLVRRVETYALHDATGTNFGLIVDAE